MCRRHDLDASGSTINQGREVLPDNVKPTNYALELEPDLEKFTFEGTVAIASVPLLPLKGLKADELCGIGLM